MHSEKSPKRESLNHRDRYKTPRQKDKTILKTYGLEHV